MDFADHTTLRLGDQTVKVRRMTIKEIRETRVADVTEKGLGDELVTRLVESHVSTADGKPLDPSALSLPQMKRLVTELVGIPEGSPISDFIALLC